MNSHVAYQSMNSTAYQTPQLFQAPIIGVGASARFSDMGYLSLGTLDDFGSHLAEGIILGIDVQSEKNGEQILLGYMCQYGTGLILTYNKGNSSSYIKIHIQDVLERKLTASAQLSKAAGKRLLIGIDPSSSIIQVTEMTIYSANDLKIEYSFRENPSEFSNLVEPLIVSGAMIDNVRVGSFEGRASNLYLVRNTLSADLVSKIKKVTLNEVVSVYGQQSPMEPNIERRQIFQDDLTKLRYWQTQPTITQSETREASTILFKWLFDHHPLLLDLCNELGIQLSLPGESEDGNAFGRKLLELRPTFYQTGILGASAPHGNIWVPLSKFRNELAFHIEGHSVSHESFVKLVRHKLGGSHFDSVDRKKWQKDLKAYSDRIRLGGIDAICFQMKMLIQAVVEAVDACGIEQQLQIN